MRVWNQAWCFCWLTCGSWFSSSCIVSEYSLLLLSRVCFCGHLSHFLATCWLREVRRGSHSEPRLAGSYVFLSDSVAGDRILIMLLWRILWNVAQITTQTKTRNKIAAELQYSRAFILCMMMFLINQKPFVFHSKPVWHSFYCKTQKIMFSCIQWKYTCTVKGCKLIIKEVHVTSSEGNGWNLRLTVLNFITFQWKKTHSFLTKHFFLL